jgi:hypothetical protein
VYCAEHLAAARASSGRPPAPAAPPPPAPSPLGPATRSTNGWAIASLCCAIAAIPTGITFVLGVVFGHVALHQLKARPDPRSHGLAVAGLVISYGWFAVLTATAAVTAFE